MNIYEYFTSCFVGYIIEIKKVLYGTVGRFFLFGVNFYEVASFLARFTSAAGRPLLLETIFTSFFLSWVKSFMARGRGVRGLLTKATFTE